MYDVMASSPILRQKKRPMMSAMCTKTVMSPRLAVTFKQVIHQVKTSVSTDMRKNNDFKETLIFNHFSTFILEIPA